MLQSVLVVCREPAQRELLTRSLQGRLGYRTFAAVTPSEAAHYFHADRQAKPDLTLLDWPGDASADPGLKSLSECAPLVVLVRYGDYDAAVAALNAGAHDFLTKPVAMERVSTTFRTLLLLRDARREVESLRQAHAEGPGASRPSSAEAATESHFIREDGNIRRMDDIEAEAIRFAMQHYHGRMTEVARRLGIGRSTLYRKLSFIGMRQEEAA